MTRSFRDASVLSLELLARIPAGLLILGADGGVLFMNDAAKLLVGGSLRVTPGDALAGDAVRALLERAASGETLRAAGCDCRAADGSERQVAIDAWTVTGDEEVARTTIVIVRDVTMSHGTHDASVRLVAHEVRTQISAADIHVQLLESGLLGQLDVRQSDAVHRVRAQLTSALSLLDDLIIQARSNRASAERLLADRVVPQLTGGTGTPASETDHPPSAARP